MQTKEKYVLGLFMDPSSYIEGVLLGEQAVECVPENLASALLYEHLDINLIQKFFAADGERFLCTWYFMCVLCI